MNPGEGRKGDVVYTRHKLPGESIYRIVRVEIANVVYPGTTNEFFQVFYQHLEGSQMLDRKPRECDKDSTRARNQLILEVQDKMKELNAQLMALGVHTDAPSFWKGR